MADEVKMKFAKQVFETICAALDDRKWTYKKDEDKLSIWFGVNGDDIPMQLVFVVDAKRQIVCMSSPLPFKMSEDKRIEGAVAVCMASYGMADGSFDYDIADGSIAFRATETFEGCQLGKGVFDYMINLTCAMVDRYNDKFLALSKGLVDITAFQES